MERSTLSRARCMLFRYDALGNLGLRRANETNFSAALSSSRRDEYRESYNQASIINLVCERELDVKHRHRRLNLISRPKSGFAGNVTLNYARHKPNKNQRHIRARDTGAHVVPQKDLKAQLSRFVRYLQACACHPPKREGAREKEREHRERVDRK